MGASPGTGNRGVSALSVSLIGLCLEAEPQAELKLLIGHDRADSFKVTVNGTQRTIPVVHCRLSPWSRLQEHLAWITVLSILFRLSSRLRARIRRANPWIRAVADADLIGDIRGGDSFSDIYGLKEFLLGFVMSWTVLLVKRDIVHFPQTYGPYKNSIAEWLARYLLRHSSTVMARDTHSQAVAQRLRRSRTDVLLSPDVAFSLEARRPTQPALDPPLQTNAPGKHVIGVNVNALMYNSRAGKNPFGLSLDYRAFLRMLVIALLRKTDGELWLVPHTFAPASSSESDPEASRQLRASLPQELRSRVRIVAADYDQHEIKGVIGMCDFFIGSRMHSCIAALSQGVPCVGVAYSMKFLGVFESVGMAQWVIDGRRLGSAEAVQRILDLYTHRDEVRAGLKQRAGEAETQVRRIFRGLIANRVTN
jgi:polysaccharide pyruvyl transferase WcaK-like protein